MVILADEVDQQALLANPFLDLTVLTAARAFLAERETLTKPPPGMSAITAVLTRQWSEASLERCKAILAKMSKYVFSDLSQSPLIDPIMNVSGIGVGSGVCGEF
jgi:hypothetical protein